MSEDNADVAAPKPVLPMFRLHGQPLKLPPEFATALAHVVVEWSRLEDAITRDFEWMMGFQVVADLVREPPRAFNKKLDLWRRAVNALFKNVPQYRELVAHLVPRAKELARIRNILVHGAWPLDNPTPEGKFKVINMIPVGDGKVRLEQIDIDHKDLESLTAEVLDLAGLVLGVTMSRMLHAHHGLLKASPAQEPEGQAHPSPPTESKP